MGLAWPPLSTGFVAPPQKAELNRYLFDPANQLESLEFFILSLEAGDPLNEVVLFRSLVPEFWNTIYLWELQKVKWHGLQIAFLKISI